MLPNPGVPPTCNVLIENVIFLDDIIYDLLRTVIDYQYFPLYS
jgi:hypothetical protein